MRIAYYVEWDVTRPSGVLIKILSQLETWQNLGARARLFIVTQAGKPEHSEQTRLTEAHIESLSPHPHLLKLSKVSAIARTRRAIERFQPDLIYFRASSWTPGLLTLLRQAPTFVVEMNSIYQEEIPRWRIDLRLYDHLLSQRAFRECGGIICVTREFAQWAERFNRPTVTIANGYAVKANCEGSFPRNSTPQIVFALGNPAPWHGLDKFHHLAEAISDFDFHVVGVSGESHLPNLHYHGRKTRQELSELYKRMDIGVSCLALHRKNMNEASPLKDREYLAHGLPVIAAQVDTDLSGADCFLELPNTENGPIESVAAIRRFVTAWSGRRVPTSVAEELIGLLPKETRRLEFFSRTIASASVKRRKDTSDY